MSLVLSERGVANTVDVMRLVHCSGASLTEYPEGEDR